MTLSFLNGVCLGTSDHQLCPGDGDVSAPLPWRCRGDVGGILGDCSATGGSHCLLVTELEIHAASYFLT